MDVTGRAFWIQGPNAANALRWGDPDRPRVALRGTPGSSIPWAELRALVAHLRILRGDEAVDAALAPHRGPMSLIWRSLEPGLRPQEREARARAAAAVHGYLSHNSLMRLPLVRAWQGVLTPLCAGLDVLVPELAVADPQSLTVLVSLLGTQPDLRLMFGWDPDALPTDKMSRWDAGFALSTGERLRLLPGAAPAEPSLREDAPIAPAPDDSELGTLDSPEQLCEAMERAFACFGFTCCQRLGLRALRSPCADERTWRRINLLTGLSAYNRQVSTRGASPEEDAALAELLGSCFTEALAGESDPQARAHLLYRLCINSGRRKSDLPESLTLAERSLSAARGLPMAEAWARNGLAYVLGRMRRTDEAIAECIQAEALLRAPLPGVEEVERPLTRAVLLDNLVELCALAGRWEDAARWPITHDADLRIEMPPSGRTLKAMRNALRPGELRALALRGLILTEERLDPIESDWMAAHAADGAYRQGDAQAAVALYRQALASARRIAGEVEIRATETSLAMALLRAGRGGEAADALERLAGGAEDPASRAELAATRGWALAVCGDVAASESAINDAISAAVALGQRDLLARVACAAGEACLALGRPDEAGQAFRQALAMTRLGEGATAADALWALGGLMAIGVAQAAELEQALELLPEALPEAEAWWELPRLHAATLALGLPLSPVLAEFWSRRTGA